MPVEQGQKATASQRGLVKNNSNSVSQDKRNNQCVATTVPSVRGGGTAIVNRALTIQQNKQLLYAEGFSCAGCSATAPLPQQVSAHPHCQPHLSSLGREPRGICYQASTNSHLSMALLGIKPGTHLPPLPSHSRHDPMG